MFTVCSHWVHSGFDRFGIVKGKGKTLLFVAAGANFSFSKQLFFDFLSCRRSPSSGFIVFQRAFRSPSGLLRASSPMK